MAVIGLRQGGPGEAAQARCYSFPLTVLLHSRQTAPPPILQPRQGNTVFDENLKVYFHEAEVKVAYIMNSACPRSLIGEFSCRGGLQVFTVWSKIHYTDWSEWSSSDWLVKVQ